MKHPLSSFVFFAMWVALVPAIVGCLALAKHSDLLGAVAFTILMAAVIGVTMWDCHDIFES